MRREGIRGSRGVPLLSLLAERFAQVVEEVFDESNAGYHFAGTFDVPGMSRTVTVSYYPDKVFVMLASGGEPLRFWELFAFLVGWLPGMTGVPWEGWDVRQLEVNRDHLLAEGVGGLWALTRPLPLAKAVRAMVKVYQKDEGTVRAEVRLTGDVATAVLVDEVRAMLEWGERMDR